LNKHRRYSRFRVELETINKLYLELAQVATVRTGRETILEEALENRAEESWIALQGQCTSRRILELKVEDIGDLEKAWNEEADDLNTWGNLSLDEMTTFAQQRAFERAARLVRSTYAAISPGSGSST
jgi:hypothetical protein